MKIPDLKNYLLIKKNKKFIVFSQKNVYVQIKFTKFNESNWMIKDN